jgi:hypothetical protein
MGHGQQRARHEPQLILSTRRIDGSSTCPIALENALNIEGSVSRAVYPPPPPRGKVNLKSNAARRIDP